MNKSEIIRNLSYRLSDMPTADIDRAVNLLLDLLGSTIAAGNRCEVRDFGVFSRHTHRGRVERWTCLPDTQSISNRVRSFVNGLMMPRVTTRYRIEHL